MHITRRREGISTFGAGLAATATAAITIDAMFENNIGDDIETES